MSQYTQHTPESAPAGSRSILDAAKNSLGFVPNLYATMAESPAVLEGYTTLSRIFGKASFDETERQVILLTASFENGCDYCMAAHSTIAAGGGVADDVITALRDGAPIGDARLDALARFARLVVQERGWVGESALEAFLAAGFTRAQALEVVLGVGLKTISNYVDHLAEPPLDSAFEAQAWKRPVAS